jgi:26S proteasome non-ATPase regulatory subunit 10
VTVLCILVVAALCRIAEVSELALQESRGREDFNSAAQGGMEAMVGLGSAAADSDALFEAAGAGSLEVFEKLSGEGVRKARLLRNEDERTLLHVAAASGRVGVVKWIAEGVSDAKGLVNVSDEEGWTPLHSAASSGRDAVVEVLLALGADVGAANQGGRTALHYAASKNHVEIAHMLIKAGAKVNRKDGVGCTPLHRAASAGHAEMCEVLLEAGADIEATDRMGQTPLMHAVICDNRRVAFLLVRHDADVDAQDKEGYTVLGRASEEFRPLLIDAAKAMMEDS